jgi:hypothetical protein
MMKSAVRCLAHLIFQEGSNLSFSCDGRWLNLLGNCMALCSDCLSIMKSRNYGNSPLGIWRSGDERWWIVGSTANE